MKKINLSIRNILPLGHAGQFAGIIVAFAMALLLPGKLFAQKPVFTYSGPQVYTSGIAISPLSPANTGGAVAAMGYTSPARVTYGPDSNEPNVLTTNAAGDLFVATSVSTESPGGTIQNFSYVVAIRAGSGRRDSLISDSRTISSMACDAAGNLYIADWAGVSEWHPNDGSFTTLASGINAGGVTLDGAGNIYVLVEGSFASTTIEKIPAGGGTPVTLNVSIRFEIMGIAADQAGDLFVAGSGGIVEIPAGSSSTIKVANGISYSPGIASDIGGNIYAFNSNNDVVRILPDGSTFDIARGNNMLGLAADNSHNLYYSHYTSDDTVSVFKVIPTGGYLISPQLPAGLAFNPTTGTISGTPAVAAAATTYSITGYNASGSSSANVNIKVNANPTPIISYSSPQSYHKGTAITPLSPSSVGAVVSAPAFSSPSTIVLSSFYAFSNPVSIAADAAGDLLVGDPGNVSVFRLAAGASATTTVNGGIDKAGGVAFDAAGNMYLVDFEFNLVEEFPRSGSPVILGSGFSHPAGVAVDGAGNVYVTDQGHSAVKEILAGSGTIVSLGSGFSQPNGIAVDGAGNVYVTDNANSLVKKIIPGNSTPVTIGSGFNNPKGVAVDAAGNVFVADAGNNAVKEILATDGSTINIGSGFNAPNGVAVDGSGNLYVADSGNAVVKELSLVGGYYITPFLPAGLSFNNITGAISGTPTAISPSTNYNVTAYSNGISGSTILTMEVVAPPSISYGSPQTYTQGIAITPLAPANSGGTVGAGGYQTTSSVVQNGGFSQPTGIAVDASGAIYVSDSFGNDITKIANGTFTTWGSGFSNPSAIVFDAAGNLYVADAGHNAIKEVKAVNAGTVTVATGFNGPTGVAIDAAGNIYVADAGNNAVKKIPAGGGTPISIGSGFNNPTGVAVDAAGNVYVVDNGTSTVKKIPAVGNVQLNIAIGLKSPYGITIDKYGNLFIADTQNNSIKMIPAGGSMITIGSGFDTPRGVAVDAKGNVYDTDALGVVAAGGVRKIAPSGGYFITSTLPAGLSFDNTTGVISGTPTVASSSANYSIIGYNALGGSTATVNITVTPSTPIISYSSPQTYVANTAITPLSPVSSAGAVSAPAYSSSSVALTPSGPGFNDPVSIAADAAGNLLVGDVGNHAVTYLAGGTTQQTISTSINIPDGVAFDASGNRYVADLNNNMIEKFPVSGSPVTVGSGFNRPTGVAVDLAGNVYVADEGNGAVKEILAGSGAILSLGSGFTQPFSLAVDGGGNVYVTDNANNLVKKIIPGDTTPVVIGTGFSNPRGVAVDAAGNVFVADIRNNAIKEILAADGTTITIATGFNQPAGVAVDGAGNIYVADSGNGRVTKISPTGGYYIGPFLPNGLSFSETTGVISGTPTTFSPSTDYTVTAYNSVGKASAAFNITVNAVPAISYSGAQTYTENAAISPLSPANTGGPVGSFGFNTPTVVTTGISDPVSMAMDKLGNIYIGEGSGKVSKLLQGGSAATTFATGFSVVWSVALDASNNVYVADGSQLWTIPAGGGTPVSFGSFVSPVGLAFDAAGNLYVADNSGSHPGVYKLIPGVAGQTRIDNNLQAPAYVGFDNNGNLFIGDQDSAALYEIPADGSPQIQVASGFSTVKSLAVDASGNVYITGQSAIYCYSPGTGTVTVKSTFADGLMTDPNFNLYYSDGANINKMSPSGGYFTSPELPQGLGIDANTGIISGTPSAISPATNYTIKAFNAAGSAAANINITVQLPLPRLRYSGPQAYRIGTPILQLFPTSSNVNAWGYSTSVASIGSGLIEPLDVAADASGNVYVADIAAGNVVKIPAGNGTPVPLGAFPSPRGVAVDVTGNVYVANGSSPSIVKFAAGTGTVSLVGSGFSSPSAVAVDPSGNVYVADTGSGALIEVPAGNGAPVTIKTGFPSIQGVAVDAAGNIFVADAGVGLSGNGAVYEILPSGTMLTLGSGFSRPSGVVVDAAGNLYVSDINKSVVTVIEPNGTQFTIGSGFSLPNGLALDGSGNLYIADSGNGAVKEVKINGGFFLSPLLPAGLTFNNNTGAIHGTPTAPKVATDYTVTGWNGTGNATATVNIKVVSNDATINLFQISNGTLSPAFSAGTTIYADTVANFTSGITLFLKTTEPDATVKVNGTPVTSGIRSSSFPLNIASNVLNIVVTAADGVTTKTYSVTVNRSMPGNALLSTIAVSPAVTLVGTTGPGYLNFTAAVANGTANVQVIPTAQDANAVITVNGSHVVSGSPSSPVALNIGPNVITTVVTAEDGKTSKTAIITINRAGPSNNALLANIKTDPVATLVGATGPGYLNFTAAVANSTNTIKVIATAKDANATITVNGLPAVSGSPSSPIALSVGPNVITTVITAQDGVTTKTVMITVNRAPAPSNADLLSITTDPKDASLVGATGAGYLNYTELVSNSTSSIKIIATTKDPLDAITINGQLTKSGTPSLPITLAPGPNLVTIVITAEDGVTTRTVTLTLNRQNPSHPLYDIYNPVSVTKPADSVSIADDDVMVHQAVSPNGDGINDFLVIDGITSYPDNKLVIIDRNGAMVYQAQGYDNSTRLFDGHSSINGRMQLQGTYFYSLDYSDNGTPKHKTGYLVLKY